MMNKERKDAKRGLKSWEMELVNGGIDLSGTPVAPDDFYVYYGGYPMNAEAARDILKGICNAYGPDYAIEYAKNYWIPTSDWYEYYMQGGIDYAVQMMFGKMYKGYTTGESVY